MTPSSPQTPVLVAVAGVYAQGTGGARVCMLPGGCCSQGVLGSLSEPQVPLRVQAALITSELQEECGRDP